MQDNKIANYEDWIIEKIEELTPDIPVFEVAVPSGTQKPHTYWVVSFSTPVHHKRSRGIVSQKRDEFRVDFSVRMETRDPKQLRRNTDLMWELADQTPPDSGPIYPTVSGSWGSLEGKPRPAYFSQATMFYFNTNMAV